jgi:transcriptional regulator with XRE-family HTH domain
MLLQLLGRTEMSIAKNLQRVRKERGFNQEQLADSSGVSLTQISKIERNETDPRVSTIEKLAKALNCSTDQLLFDEASESLTGLLKRSFERAARLDPMSKAALLKVINMACAGGTMIQTVDEITDEAMEAIELGIETHHRNPDDLAVERLVHQEKVYAETNEYHKLIDKLAEEEAKQGLSYTVKRTG